MQKEGSGVWSAGKCLEGTLLQPVIKGDDMDVTWFKVVHFKARLHHQMCMSKFLPQEKQKGMDMNTVE